MQRPDLEIVLVYSGERTLKQFRFSYTGGEIPTS